jgi:hypothetical protein
MRIIKAWGVMTQAGAASDTAVITDGTNNVTDTADLSVFDDTDQFDFSQIDDAYWALAQGDTLQVDTASSPALRVYIMAVRT